MQTANISDTWCSHYMYGYPGSLRDIILSFYGHVQPSGSKSLKQWKYFGSPNLFSEQRPFWWTFIQKHWEKAHHLPGKGNEGRGWMGLDGIVLETEEWRSPPPPPPSLFFPNGVGWGADMARISALMGVGVGLTFWDKLRFINAPVDIKPRSSDWRGGFCLCVPAVGSSQIHPHPLPTSPRAELQLRRFFGDFDPWGPACLIFRHVQISGFTDSPATCSNALRFAIPCKNVNKKMTVSWSFSHWNYKYTKYSAKNCTVLPKVPWEERFVLRVSPSGLWNVLTRF